MISKLYSAMLLFVKDVKLYSLECSGRKRDRTSLLQRFFVCLFFLAQNKKIILSAKASVAQRKRARVLGHTKGPSFEPQRGTVGISVSRKMRVWIFLYRLDEK